MKPVAKSFRAISLGQRVYVRAPNLEGTYQVVGKTKRKIIVDVGDGRMAKVGPEVVLIARSEKSRQLLQQMVSGVQANPCNPRPKDQEDWKELIENGNRVRVVKTPYGFAAAWINSDGKEYHRYPLPGVRSKEQAKELIRKKFGDMIFENPCEETIERGVQEYEKFHWGEPPNFVAEITPPVPKGTIHGIGELVGVIYKTKKGKRGKKSDQYIHHFKKQRPVLAYDEEGKLVVVGGDYTIEDRGIVD